MRRMATRAAVVALLALSAACASAGGAGGRTTVLGDDGAADRDRPAYVVVENSHWQDVVVYADHLGSRTRLGMVSSMDTERLRLPARLRNGPDLRLVLDPIGGGAPWVSPRVRVQGGEAVRVDVQNQLSLTSLGVWPVEAVSRRP